MAHKMKKFSAGGAQGRYDRRMADIEKDYKIALAKGKNEGVAKAKYEQRKADAEDDRAKRTGADRTATRAAEKASEAALKEARRTKGMSITKRDMTNDFKKYFADKPMTAKAAKPAAETPKAKPQTTRQEFNAAFSAARAKAIKEGRDPNKEPFMFGGKKKVALMAGAGRKAPAAADKTPVKVPRNYNISPENRRAIDAAAKKEPFSQFDKAAFDKLKSAGAPPPPPPPPADPRQLAYEKAINDRDKELGKSLSALNPFGSAKTRADAYNAKLKAAGKLAKGGQITKKKPMPMGGKQLMPLKKKLTKEPITGGPDTVPATPERNEFRKEMMKRNATPGMSRGGKMKKYAAGGVTKEMPSSKAMGSLGMAKGGKAKMKPAAKGKAKSFAATKFGAAMMKKSADTKGRALPKFAKGGSIDGCAVRGKTKAKRVTMKRGGSC
jgi:hypothetical protein